MMGWRRWLGIAIALALTGYFVYYAVDVYRTSGFILTRQSAVAIVGAGLLAALVVPLSGTAWSLILADLGCDRSPARLSAILGYTQLAKYAPGNVLHHVGRTAVALLDGIPAAPYFSSLLVETMLLLAAGVTVGSLCALLSPFPLSLPGIFPDGARWLLLAIAVAFAVVPILLSGPLLAVLRRIQRSGAGAPATVSPSIPAAAKAFALYCIAYFVLGLALMTVALGIGMDRNINVFALTSGFALAWLVGYLAPGVPAGIGAREGALVLLLAGTEPAELVLSLAVAARFATMLADGFCFLVSSIIVRKWYRLGDG